MADAKNTDWKEWSGDASLIPSAIGWVQFNFETREAAMLRDAEQIDIWPWFDDSGNQLVVAYKERA